jgi:cell division GTPase FtsZ
MELKAIKFGFVGVGEGGSRIAQSFSVKKYPVCVINTRRSDSDCLEMKNSTKLVLDCGIVGTSRDLSVGGMIISENRDLILEFLKSKLSGEDNFLIHTIGGGGGSGTGWLTPGIQLCKEVEVPTGVIYTLPLNSEDKTTKSNCIRGLKTLYELIQRYRSNHF